jgi:hypothetical protein
LAAFGALVYNRGHPLLLRQTHTGGDVTFPLQTTRAALVAAMCLAVSPLHAADGVLIVEKTTTGGNTKTNQIQIEKDRMRAETAGQAGESQTVVFDGAKQTLWLINDGRKTYSELTKADADRLGGQMSDAMAKMQEQLKGLPPEQRAQIEAMMKGRGMPGMTGGQAPKTEYRKTGTDKVGSWTCDKYEGSQNNQKVSELCTVEPRTLGFSLADFQVTKQMAEFFRKLVPQGADSMFTVGTPEEQGYNGVPVRRVTFRNGQQQSMSETTEARRQTFPASVFEVPPGFQKEAFGGGRGRGQ